MPFPFAVVSGKTVKRLLDKDLPACLQVVREAYLTHGRGQSVNPNSFFLRFPDNPSARIIGLPAHLGAGFGVSGIKWISSYPTNVKKGFPRASAVLILNDAQTGYPYACLESSIISAARTAGSAALAAETLNSGKTLKSLGLVGTGLIARYVYQFLLGLGWEVGELNLYDADPQEAARFRDAYVPAGKHTRVELSKDLATLMRSSDAIVFATTAATPHVKDPALVAHRPLVLHLSLRDLAPELLLSAYNVVDDVGHVMNADTSPHLAEKLTGGRAFVTGTLAEVLEGKVRVGKDKPIFFSPFGLGVLDLAVGKWIYDQAAAAGELTEVPDFFHELTR
jgi:N-[(2S)-2-amino-2-carboxyethyl]-L-glutamate dehydrogenase